MKEIARAPAESEGDRRDLILGSPSLNFRLRDHPGGQTFDEHNRSDYHADASGGTLVFNQRRQ
jgi:hypothetical protein